MAKKELERFYSSGKALSELGYSDYEAVSGAGYFLGKTDRDIEQERAIYNHSSVVASPSFVFGRHSVNASGSAFVLADPPEPSPVEGDKWCDRCDNCQRCAAYRSGKFCDGASFVPLKDEREVKL
jgi:hypothetical protein